MTQGNGTDVHEPKKSRYKPVTELMAMDKASAILDQLDATTRRRVLSWLTDRFNQQVAPTSAPAN